MLGLASACLFFSMVGALITVGLVSWHRTGPVRRGSILRARDPPRHATFTSSRTARLAALAGATAAAWGVTAAGRGGIEAVPLIAVGSLIAIAGSVARVTGIRTGDDGVVVLFARRRPFRAGWTEVLGLRPPGTPMGGWRLSHSLGARTTLMPSDLFGHEEVLALIIREAGLRFDGRTWTRGPIRSRRSLD